MAATEDRLVGRSCELAHIDRLLDAVAERGAALVLCGEPGIGKSFLLAAAGRRAAARGFRVLSSAGAVPEAGFAFAALHRLLRPLLDLRAALPGPQRLALDGAFGVRTPDADLYLVAMAALTLIDQAATDAPILLSIDDWQWIDRPSRDVLNFVVRRIESDPIVALATSRDEAEPAPAAFAAPRLAVGALEDADAQRLLDAAAPGLTETARRRVLRLSAGNPLALCELPAALSGQSALAEIGGPAVVPITARIEQSFAARVGDLPAAARRLLLAAALDETGRVDEAVRACAELDGAGDPLAALDAAVGSGLVRVSDQELRFRHPLIRSAVYHSAGLADRRRAHGALGRAIQGDPDRRAWHRAAAVLGRDAAAADELAAAALRMHRCGATSVAVRWLALAARLSERTEARTDRLLLLAELAFQLGRGDLVGEAIAEAGSADLAPVPRARLEWLREMIGVGMSAGAGRIQVLLAAARDAVAADDRMLGSQLLLAAGLHCWWGRPGPAEAHAIVTAVEDIDDSGAEPLGTAAIGLASPIEHRDVVVARLQRVAPDVRRRPDALRMLGTAANAVGEYAVAERHLADAAAGYRAEGRLGLLAHARNMQAWMAIDLGNLATATTAGEEALQLCRETAQTLWIASSLLATAFVRCVRGDAADAQSRVAEADHLLEAMSMSDLTSRRVLIPAVIHLAAGDPEAALPLLLRLVDPDDPAFHRRQLYASLTYLADAATLCGRPEVARAAVRGVGLGPTSDPPLGLRIGLAYAAAVLGDEDTFAPGGACGPFIRGRFDLARGRRLRRAGAVQDSRVHLRAARDAFESLDARPWAEMARQELRAAGEASRRRPADAWHQLSPQEQQIAELAAEGLTNREIGQRLYLSHRTVASHLYRLFPKLGITSRAQLARVLETQPGRS